MSLTKKRRKASCLLGFRVKSTDGLYVHRKQGKKVAFEERSVSQILTEVLGAYPEKPEPMSRADAYRLMADWLDAGYTPVLFRVSKP